MKWQKKGLIFTPSGQWEWSKTHAQVPVVDVLEDKLRIYYATRNTQGKSNISFIETDKYNPSKILFIHPKPILNFGPIGTFDDSGLMPSCIININNSKFLYYIGWTTKQTVPYHNAIGLAISENNGIDFNKKFYGPIITTNQFEPYFSGTSFVFYDNNIYKMYYLSCIKWELIDNKPEPFYNIKYAESKDGIFWKQTGQVVIDLKNDEGGIASASVIKKNHNYYMFYSYRGKKNYRFDKNNSYKIGYAISSNGIDWIRKDNEIEITLSEEGWDSQMLAYPYVVEINNTIYMFYNGNGFGQSGFGYAILEDSL